jgi:hypothetical protein
MSVHFMYHLDGTAADELAIGISAYFLLSWRVWPDAIQEDAKSCH